MSFKNLGLQQEIVQAIEEKGYTEATPIQIKVIPLIIEGHDILASAQTGTGKTAGFTLPLLQVLMDTRKNEHKPRRTRAYPHPDARACRSSWREC